jgi:hypothetical protein
MHLIVLTEIIVLMLITLNSQVSIAKHSSSEEKKDSTDSEKTQTNEPTNPTNNQNGDSTNVPTVGNVVIAISEGDTVTVTTCSNGSDKTNDQICTAEQTNQQETVVQQQNTVTPHMTQPVHTGYLDNSLNTISTQDNDINDTTLLS